MNSSNLINKKKPINSNNKISSLLIYIFTISIFLIKSTNSRDCPQKPSLVKSLPNFKGIYNNFPCIYSGFINLNEEKMTNIFYVLITKTNENPFDENSKENSPLSIWLNGGPGISSMIGLFSDMGPFNLKRINSNSIDLELNEMASWSKLSNILLVDQPVGTGFSFTNSTEEIPKTQKEISHQFYKFIQGFFSVHNEMAEKDFYLLGQNYAGKYIPEIADKIIQENSKIKKKESSFKYIINLKKIAIGNGLFDAKYQKASSKYLAKGINLLSELDDESQFDLLSQKCEYELSNKSERAGEQCDKIIEYLSKISGGVSKYDVRKSENSGNDLIENLNYYLNLETVVENLHVKTVKENYYYVKNEKINNENNENNKEKINNKNHKKFEMQKYFNYENPEIKKILNHDINFYSSLPLIEKLIEEHKIPMILYAGQFDLLEGPGSMERAVQNLNFSFKEKFNNSTKNLWKIPIGNGKFVTGGYIKQIENLALITMRNAGHFAQIDRPGTSYDLLQHLFSKENTFKCLDGNNCNLSNTKCSFMNNCNDNGHCDETTAGKCLCHKDFYGPDCSLTVEPLITGDYSILPREVKLLHMDDFQKDILIEIDSDHENLVISLLDKNDHEFIYDYKKHQVDYRMTSRKLILYLERDKFFNSIITIQNFSFEKKVNLNVYIDFYSKGFKSFFEIFLNFFQIFRLFLTNNSIIVLKFFWIFFNFLKIFSQIFRKIPFGDLEV